MKLPIALIILLLGVPVFAQTPPTLQGVASPDTENLSMAGCVRADAAAVATGVADGDRARCIVDASGRVWVNVGTSALPTGAATSAKQDTIIGHVDGIEAALAGTLTVGLPSGASTAAKQDTIIGHLDGVEGLLTTIDADTGAIKTAAEAIQAAIEGTLTVNVGLTDTELRATPVPVSGTVAVTGVSTAAKQDTIIGHVDGIEALLDGIIKDGAGDTTQANVSSGRLHVSATGTITADAGTNLNTSALLTTAQHDAAFGTAGSADAQVRSIQGVASMTPVQVQSNSANLATEASVLLSLTSANFAAAFGTAGTADTQVMSVQGIAGMTKILVTPDSVALPANQSVNTAQFGGTNISTGAGAGGAGIPRVTVSNDSSLAANQSVNVNQVGGAAAYRDPCQREAKLYLSISQTTGTELINGTAAERIYICSFHIVSATAQNIALVSGTGTVCATSITGMDGFGGSTAATGWNLAANGGLVLPASGFAYGNSTADDDNVCLLQSGAGQVSGGLTYVSAASSL